MIHAYNKVYLSDVMRNLACLFDIAINAEGLEPDEFSLQFTSSFVALGIEKGNPSYLCGKSATEMLSEILKKAVEYTKIPMDRTPEYWAGWVLGYTQWYLNKTFQEILSVISFSTLISLYYPYHEASEMKTVEYIRSLFPKDTALKQIRLLRNLTQQQLADLSCVNIRNIRSYEQRNNDICKANAETLLALAKVLDCSIEDLLN